MIHCFPPCPVAETLPFPGALAITSISPETVMCTAPNTLVHVYGQSFTDTCVIQLDGVAQTTTFVSPDELTFSAPSSTVLTPKTSAITVVDGTKTAQGSETLEFTAAPAAEEEAPTTRRRRSTDLEA